MQASGEDKVSKITASLNLVGEWDVPTGGNGKSMALWVYGDDNFSCLWGRLVSGRYFLYGWNWISTFQEGTWTDELIPPNEGFGLGPMVRLERAELILSRD